MRQGVGGHDGVGGLCVGQGAMGGEQVGWRVGGLFWRWAGCIDDVGSG